MNPNQPNDPSAMSLPQPQMPGSPMASPMHNTSPAQPLTPAAMPPLPELTPVRGQDTIPNMPAMDTVGSADDATTSLTEAAWIAKTKQVISATSDNPYQMVEDLYKLRAAFMQDVHGRELKQKEQGL